MLPTTTKPKVLTMSNVTHSKLLGFSTIYRVRTTKSRPLARIVGPTYTAYHIGKRSFYMESINAKRNVWGKLKVRKERNVA